MNGEVKFVFFVVFFFWGGGGRVGSGWGQVEGGQGRCERRREVFVKKMGGGSGRGSG